MLLSKPVLSYLFQPQNGLFGLWSILEIDMSLSSAAAKASFRYPSNNLLRASTPSSGRAKIYQKSQRRDSTFTSIGDTSSINSEEDESYARTDYGLESPTIGPFLIIFRSSLVQFWSNLA